MLAIGGSSFAALKTWTIVMFAGALLMEAIAVHRLGHSPFVGHMSAYFNHGATAYLIGWELGLPWLVLQVAGRVPQSVGKVACALAVTGALVAVAMRALGLSVMFEPSFHMLVSAIALPGIAFAIYTVLARSHLRQAAGGGSIDELCRWYWWLFVLLLSSQAFSLTGLMLSATTWSQTWDAIVYKLDHGFGGSPAGTLHIIMKSIVGLETVTRFAYASILFSAYICMGMVLRNCPTERVNLWAYVITPFWLPLIFYNWVPATGPLYAFPVTFPATPDPSMLALAPFAVPTAPRNAMPSMHLSAAILLLIAACVVRVRWVQIFAAIMVAMTAWATLALGEHYLIDLVVAIPACAVIAYVTLQPGRNASRIEIVSGLSSLVILVGWLSLLRSHPIALTHPPTLWTLAIVGSAVGVASIFLTIRSVRLTR